jgi:glutamate dehydrogenase
MTAEPKATGIDCPVDWDKRNDDCLTRAYADTYRGLQASVVTAPMRVRPRQLPSPELLGAHRRLGRYRWRGACNIAAYGESDAGGFGPALQIVTDEAPMQLESVTVLLSRLGLAYLGIMNPVFRVHRNDAGELVDMRSVTAGEGGSDGTEEEWIHVQLAPGVDRKALAEAERLLPSVLTDAQLVAADSGAIRARLLDLAGTLNSDPGGRCEAAELLSWLADGRFVLVGYQRCVLCDRRAHLDQSSRLGVLRSRQDVFPQLTDSDDVVVLVHATRPSYRDYDTYPYVLAVRENVVVRDNTEGARAIEHRFVGLFTVAATNANVLEIPVVSRRVKDALRKSGRDMTDLSGHLLLDVMQTFPRSELFALDAG